MLRLLRRVGYFFRRRREQADVAAEMEIHREIKQHQFEQSGMSVADATAASRRAMGNVLLAQEDARAVWVSAWLDQLWQDTLFGLRTLRKNAGFTTVAILTLALGIGANTATFSVVNTVLLKPFAYRDPRQIVMFQNVFESRRVGTTSPTEFNLWRQQTQAFQDIAAYNFDVANITGSSPEQIPIMHVSADFFQLCGTNPVQGRAFRPADDAPNAPKTVVLAYAFWQRRFGGTPNIIGSHITLNGESYEIIGVVGPTLQDGQVTEQQMASGDIHIHESPDAYIPFQLDPNSADHGHFFNVAGRLKPGVTLAAANAQLQASYSEFRHKWPEVDAPERSFGVQPLQDAIVGNVRKPLMLLLGAVSLVLLIACANVASLLLARGTGRGREIAIRSTLGAGRGRILRQLFVESMMLSIAAGVVGLATGYAGIRAILLLIPNNIPRVGADGVHVTLDWRVLAFTLALSLLTGMLFGLLPAFKLSLSDLSNALKQDSARSSGGLQHNQTRALLVTIEMTLAVVLLIGAGLLIRSFIAIRHVDPGFDPKNVVTTRLLLAGPQFQDPANAIRIREEGVRRLRALPGVEAVAVSCCLPMEDQFLGPFQIVGRPESSGVTGSQDVSADYFDVFKIPLLRGRTFTEQDESGPPVAIINQAIAKQFWPNSDALHEHIIAGGKTREIIGVVGAVHDDFLHREPRRNVYYPQSFEIQGLRDPWVWVIRTTGEPMSRRAAIEKELLEVSAGLPLGRFRTMEQVVSRSTAYGDFSTLVMTIFGCSAVLLAAIGIYGVMAYTVTQRSQEIGIRIALGAQSPRIRSMLLLQGLRPTLAGVICGIAAALGLTRWIASLLFGVPAWDPLVFFTVPAILVAVALLALWLPAMRASRIDPMRTLRCD
jgi:putative ABC transport system permease protein